MAKPPIPFSPPSSLSPLVGGPMLAEVGSVWDVGINGVGFMLSTLDQESPFEFRSYEIQAIPSQKPRIDDAEEPGEQTLAGWWARAQHSWHEGAGQHIFDSPFSSRFKFSQSRGINIWDDGQLSLLPDTEQIFSAANDDIKILSAANALFYCHNGNITRDPDPYASGEADESTLATHSGTLINDITSDGSKLYAAFSGGSLGIKSTPVAGALAWTNVNSLTAVEILAWVKGRLMGSKGGSLYEFDLAATTAPDPFYTDTATGYRFTAITEMGPGIYFSGGVGDRSEVWVARLTAQDIPFASLATVGALRNVWTAPEGEVIHSIHGYGGKQLLIGTSKGVRVGTVSTGEGDIEVSALVTLARHSGNEFGTQHPILCFEPQEGFAWFGWTRFDGTYSGVGRMHLGNLAWASDLMFASQGDVVDIAYYDGNIFFVVDEGTTRRVIGQHETDYVASGWLSNNEIRFATTERKTLRYFDILSSGTGEWSLDISNDGQPFVPFETNIPVGGLQEKLLDREATRYGVRLWLHRPVTSNILTPVVREWRLRADPRARGRFRYFITLMVYDFVVTQNGVDTGEIGKAMADLNGLMTLYREDTDFLFQGPETGIVNAPPSPMVKLEDLRFKKYAPPAGGRGYGGLCLLIAREVR